MTESAMNRTAGSSNKKREAIQKHRLKCWPEFFEPIRRGQKKHDLRRSDDRDFVVGDELHLEEFDPDTNRFTGRTLRTKITYITSGQLPCALSKDALHPDFCILSIELI